MSSLPSSLFPTSTKLTRRVLRIEPIRTVPQSTHTHITPIVRRVKSLPFRLDPLSSSTHRPLHPLRSQQLLRKRPLSHSHGSLQPTRNLSFLLSINPTFDGASCTTSPSKRLKLETESVADEEREEKESEFRRSLAASKNKADPLLLLLHRLDELVTSSLDGTLVVMEALLE